MDEQRERTTPGTPEYPRADDPDGLRLSLSIPLPDPDLFRHAATNDVLRVLATSHDAALSISDLADRTGAASSSVSAAVDRLERNDLVETERTGSSRLVAIDRDRLTVPDDPVTWIPQASFQAPTRAAVEALVDRLAGVVAIVCHGSVARGDAGRLSDVALWVLVADDRQPARRAATGVVRDLEDRRFGDANDRYTFDVTVESLATVPEHTADVSRVLGSGIPVYSTAAFETVAEAVEDLAGDALES